jgi:hypothetical protein
MYVCPLFPTYYGVPVDGKSSNAAATVASSITVDGEQNEAMQTENTTPYIYQGDAYTNHYHEEKPLEH